MTLLAMLSSACAPPSNKTVTSAFQKEHPTVTITDVGSGEGDGGTVYKHIRYRRPGSTVECEIVWGYQETKGGMEAFPPE